MQAVQVTSEVNAWVEIQTIGLIKELLPPGSINRLTRLIFANAIYFKGAWNQKFDASKTMEHDFHLLNGDSTKVPFMTNNTKQFVKAFDGFKVLRLPYKQGEDNKRQFSMYFLLPDVNDGLPSLIKKVSSEAGFLNRHIPNRKVKVNDFKIPRFKISFGFETSKVLKGLGVESPFTEGGLTEMTDSPGSQNLYVSDIFQKSFIEVNEEGTEAAASTGATFVFCSAMIEKELDFVADHPFMFVIREDITGVVLFSGHIMNPLES
ncbi:Serpin-ZX [Bienertia sinuspersici]